MTARLIEEFEPEEYGDNDVLIWCNGEWRTGWYDAACKEWHITGGGTPVNRVKYWHPLPDDPE